MNAKFITLVMALMMLMAASAVSADFTVGKVSLSSKSWGNQTATFKIENTGAIYKTVVALSDVTFSGGLLNPRRVERKIILIAPEESAEVELPVTIPGEFGNCNVRVRLFDVVDTLDQLLPTQQFYDDTTTFTFEMSPELKKIISEYIHVPAFVENNDHFDNSFIRVLLYLIYLGKSSGDIAELCNADPTFVEYSIAFLEGEGYLKITGGGLTPTFTVINTELAQKARPAIDKAIEDLYQLLLINVPRYENNVRALVAEGILTSNPEDLIDPGSVLHHKYPVVLGLFLWHTLGNKYINDGEPFDIFEDSDPCNAMMGDYMYLVNAGEKDFGRGFYYAVDGAKQRFYCGIRPMPIQCDPKYRDFAKKERKPAWSFDRSHSAVFYTYTDMKVQIPVSMLNKGTESIISKLQYDVDKVFNTDNQGAYIKGARYWCWNLVVQELVEKLEAKKIIEQEGEGTFSFTIPGAK